VFSDVGVAGGQFRRARFSDVWLHTVRWVGTDLADSGWADADLVSCVLAGSQMHGAQLRAVVFAQCKLNSVNLRGARLQDVGFVDCLLRDVDLGGATLENVAFPGSTLEGVRLRDAALDRVDLRGAASLHLADGFGSLRGATISAVQLLELAGEFACELGVAVD
jgi:uncharacterized protein YjbI with pentapeptide repeats